MDIGGEIKFFRWDVMLSVHLYPPWFKISFICDERPYSGHPAVLHIHRNRTGIGAIGENLFRHKIPPIYHSFGILYEPSFGSASKSPLPVHTQTL
jgi:hypothetical protein